jgi:hypothetical protein
MARALNVIVAHGFALVATRREPVCRERLGLDLTLRLRLWTEGARMNKDEARPGEVIPTAASPVVSNATMRALEQRGYRFRPCNACSPSIPCAWAPRIDCARVLQESAAELGEDPALLVTWTLAKLVLSTSRACEVDVAEVLDRIGAAVGVQQTLIANPMASGHFGAPIPNKSRPPE